MPIEGIQRLLPSQIYNYVENRSKIRSLLVKTNSLNDDERKDEFKRIIRTSLKNLTVIFKEKDIWLGITGGRDSRLTLACCIDAKIPIKTFTYDVEVYPNDNIVAKKITKNLQLQHLMLKGEKQFSKARYDIFRNHTTGMVNDFEQILYSYDMLEAIRQKSDKDVIIIGSNYWEQIVNYYEVEFSEKEDIRNIFAKTHPKLLESVDDWLKIIERDTINKELSFFDRMYWDLRCGCWAADKWQAWDLEDRIHIVQLLNSRRLVSILMGVSSELRQRVNKLIEVQITNELCPQLSTIRYEDELNRDFMSFFRNLISSIANLCKKTLPKKLYNLIKLSNWKPTKIQKVKQYSKYSN